MRGFFLAFAGKTSQLKYREMYAKPVVPIRAIFQRCKLHSHSGGFQLPSRMKGRENLIRGNVSARPKEILVRNCSSFFVSLGATIDRRSREGKRISRQAAKSRKFYLAQSMLGLFRAAV